MLNKNYFSILLEEIAEINDKMIKLLELAEESEDSLKATIFMLRRQAYAKERKRLVSNLNEYVNMLNK